MDFSSMLDAAVKLHISKERDNLNQLVAITLLTNVMIDILPPQDRVHYLDKATEKFRSEMDKGSKDGYEAGCETVGFVRSMLVDVMDKVEESRT